MNQLDGAGIFLLLNHQDTMYVLLMYNFDGHKYFYQEPGGHMKIGQLPAAIAKSELYEESFASLKLLNLKPNPKVTVNNRYVSYPVYLKVKDLDEFKQIMEDNKQILLRTTQPLLDCYKECFDFELVKLNDLIGRKNNKLKHSYIHDRTLAVLNEYITQEIITMDGEVKIEESKYEIKKIEYKQGEMLSILNGNMEYLIN